MLKKITFPLSILFFILSGAGIGLLSHAAPETGSALPPFELPAPDDITHRRYLGLTSAESTFRIAQIDADAVIVEIFSMYCPHCQREAPKVNQLYRLIEKDPLLRGRIKIVGIGVGNSAYEVDYFRKSYEIPFPLFPDENFTIHKQMGEVRTPFFIGVRPGSNHGAVVFLTHLGGFASPAQFLHEIQNHPLLKEGK